MIFVALGANLPHPEFGQPVDTLAHAVEVLDQGEVAVVATARWHRSDAVPDASQPPFINGMVRVETGLGPEALLSRLHKIEHQFGRVRAEINAPRVLDLDLIAYDDQILSIEKGLVLPHPRLSERAFVLMPLADLAPDWCHPVSGETVSELLAGLDARQICVPLTQ